MRRLARAYGCWPHEVERLSPYELAMAQLCLEDDEREGDEMRRAARGKIQPVFVVGGGR